MDVNQVRLVEGTHARVHTGPHILHQSWQEICARLHKWFDTTRASLLPLHTSIRKIHYGPQNYCEIIDPVSDTKVDPPSAIQKMYSYIQNFNASILSSACETGVSIKFTKRLNVHARECVETITKIIYSTNIGRLSIR